MSVNQQLLQECITHWKENLEAELPSYASLKADNCSFCQVYSYLANPKVKLQNQCRGCPISDKTGLINCRGTPYNEAWDAHQSWSFEYRIHNTNTLRAKFRAHCQDMINFLESLIVE